VLGEQLRLDLTELGKARLQYLGNALMVLLARTAQQGLIGCLLNQDVLETVRRLGRQSLLVQELCLHQLLQPPLQGRLVPRRDGLQQDIGEFAPQGRPELRQALHGRQAVQSCHQRVVQRGGNGQWG
jgi:hypothetical protein